MSPRQNFLATEFPVTTDVRTDVQTLEIIVLDNDNHLSITTTCFCTMAVATALSVSIPPLLPPVLVGPDLTSFKYADLFKATENEISAILWCQSNGLIAKDKKCIACGSSTEIRERQTDKTKLGICKDTCMV